ncbi:MAG: (2Fe-2S) ferredoxin domain-containing protein [Spirochaetes bacterium]|nr:(2Fe-2S) ferredoxin domain-containing protein [Spirochaetota bacterium]
MIEKITSPQDLLKMRDQARGGIELRGGPKERQIIVHTGTCGIAAGARDVLAELAAELDRKSVTNVTVRQSGCIGLCDQEPMLTLTDKAGRNFLYVNLTKDKVREIVAGHLVAGEPVAKYINDGAEGAEGARGAGGDRT